MNDFVSLLNEIHDKFMNNFKSSGFLKKENISESENYYLNIIYSLKKITLTKFASEAEVTKPAATQIINKFIDKGYVTKKLSNNDKRVCYIELTNKLKKYFNGKYKELNEMYERCLLKLSQNEQDELNNILLKINNSL